MRSRASGPAGFSTAVGIGRTWRVRGLTAGAAERSVATKRGRPVSLIAVLSRQARSPPRDPPHRLDREATTRCAITKEESSHDGLRPQVRDRNPYGARWLPAAAGQAPGGIRGLRRRKDHEGAA